MAVDLKIAGEILFSEEQLLNEFNRRHRDSTSRGMDRRNGATFAATADKEIPVVSRKCLDATYEFTPYMEVLKVKGHRSLPRRIGIPAIRDRVVLAQLNKMIRIAFPIESKSPLASSYVRNLAKYLQGIPVSKNWTAGCDIKRFYDSLDRARLLKIIGKRLGGHQAFKLIKVAIETPIVPATYRRNDVDAYIEEKGVPQGLAISNALATIYLHEVDQAMQDLPVAYYRFVDDVLVIGGKEETKRAQRSFAARVRARGLSVHKLGEKKSHHLPLSMPFNYLGYSFSMPKVTVRDSTVERLIHSLAGKISDYKHNHQRVVERKEYLTEETYKNIFLDELNERISGAISMDKKYGWVAYFSEINDLSILHRMDVILVGLLGRVEGLKEFSGKTKKFSRAYFEMRHRPYAGYVRNYDEIHTPAQMIKFLSFRGRIGPGVNLDEDQIRSRFENYRNRQLGLMLADEAQTY